MPRGASSGRRGGHRVDGDGGLPALELVDGAHPIARPPRAGARDRARPARCTARRSGCRCQAQGCAHSASRRPATFDPGQVAALGEPRARARHRVGLLVRLTAYCRVGDRQPAQARCRRAAPAAVITPGLGPVARLSSACVEHLRREVADVRMQPPGRGRGRGPVVPSMVVARSPSRCSRPTRRPLRVDALDGLVELLRVAEQHEAARRRPSTASTLASDIWPASSTKSTSTRRASPGRAHSHAVPAATWTSPASSAARSPRVLRRDQR